MDDCCFLFVIVRLKKKGKKSVCSPVSQIIGLDIFRPRELSEDDLVLALDDLLLVDVVLAQQTQRVGHGRARGSRCLGRRENLTSKLCQLRKQKRQKWLLHLADKNSTTIQNFITDSR